MANQTTLEGGPQCHGHLHIFQPGTPKDQCPKIIRAPTPQTFKGWCVVVSLLFRSPHGFASTALSPGSVLWLSLNGASRDITLPQVTLKNRVHMSQTTEGYPGKKQPDVCWCVRFAEGVVGSKQKQDSTTKNVSCRLAAHDFQYIPRGTFAMLSRDPSFQKTSRHQGNRFCFLFPDG